MKKLLAAAVFFTYVCYPVCQQVWDGNQFVNVCTTQCVGN